MNSYNTQRWYYEEYLTCIDRDSTRTFLGRRNNTVMIHLASRRMYHDLNVNCSLQAHCTLGPQMVMLFKMSIRLEEVEPPGSEWAGLGGSLGSISYPPSASWSLEMWDTPDPMLGHHEVCLPKLCGLYLLNSPLLVMVVRVADTGHSQKTSRIPVILDQLEW